MTDTAAENVAGVAVPCGFDEANGFGYVLSGYAWAKPEVTFSFAADGVGTPYGANDLHAKMNARHPEEKWKGEVRRAFAEWSRHTLRLKFREVEDGGGDIGVGRVADIRITGAVRADSAAGASAYYPTGTARAGDVMFNTRYAFGVGEGGLLDVFSVVLHEIGHAVGIRHADKGPSVMAATVGFGPVYSGLYPEDILAVQALYGAPPVPEIPDDDWPGLCGTRGHALAGWANSLPGGAAVTPSGHQVWTWAANTADPRALAKPGGGRVAACWYSGTQFELKVVVPGDAPELVTLYCVDWDKRGRSQTVEVLDAGGNVLDSRAVSAFGDGVYLTFSATGGVRLRVRNTGPVNAVVSGVFLGGPPAPPVAPCPFEVLPDGRTLRVLWSEPVRGAAVAGGLSASADGERVRLTTPATSDPSHEFVWTVPADARTR